MSVFVDTSAFYALADQDDEHHVQAKDIYSKFKEDDKLVTSDYILVECWFLISSNLGRREALQFWDALMQDKVEMMDIDVIIRERSREIIEEYPDQPFSLVDATTFALLEIEKEKMDRVFTFDFNFREYRFCQDLEDYFEGHFDIIPEIEEDHSSQ